VLEYRMKKEYGVDIIIQRLPYTIARWIVAEKVTREMLGYTDSSILVEDRYNRPVALFTREWDIKRVLDKNKGMQLLEVSPL